MISNCNVLCPGLSMSKERLLRHMVFLWRNTPVGEYHTQKSLAWWMVGETNKIS